MMAGSDIPGMFVEDFINDGFMVKIMSSRLFSLA
jgi:hypothetical protein